MEASVPFAPMHNSGEENNSNSVDEFGSNNSLHPELFTGESLLELCNSFWMRPPGAKSDVQPYLRGCKWSPDGTCCLSVVNHDGFHIMELPHDLYDGCPSRDRMITLLSAAIHVKEAGLVYDFCWYPKMNSHIPETCSWISTKSNAPIQMWDAYNGSLRCSYRGFNAVDEMEPALSVIFTRQGEQIVGGYKGCLRTFAVERPGRDFIEHKMKFPASCLATHSNMLAVGSWNSHIKLFNILDSVTYKSIGNLHAHTGGITHLTFTPDGMKLVSGARKDHNLFVWDVRYYRRPLNILKRCVSTNQRIYFDISSCGRYLISGGTDGVIRVWDEKYNKWANEFSGTYDHGENATYRFRLHQDCCNSISIHPSRPILATGSGQYHMVDPVKVLEYEHDSSESSEKIDSPKNINFESDDSSSETSVQEEVENTDVLYKEKHLVDDKKRIQVAEQHETVNGKASDEIRLIDSVNELPLKREIGDIEEPPPRSSEDVATKKIRLDIAIDTPSNILCKYQNVKMPITFCDNETIVMHPSHRVNTAEEGPDKEPIQDMSTNTTEVSNVDDLSIQNVTLDVDSEALGNEKKLTVVDKVISPTPDMDNSSNSSEKHAERNDAGRSSESLNPEISNYSVYNKTVIATDSECKANKEPAELKVAIRSQSPSKSFKLNKIERTAGNVPNMVCTAKEPPDDKYNLATASDSDDDTKDINENKMKYSSYAENNLTFWWLAKIIEN